MSEIVYQIDRKISRKNTYITIKNDATILIKTNFFVTKKSIDLFVEKKMDWILKHQNNILKRKQTLENGVYILGVLHKNCTYTKEELENIYEQKAKEFILNFIDIHSKRMQLFPNKISFRKNKTRWGSCSAKNNLSFNIYLAKTPVEFIEYVTIHELAHIRHKNHSKEFWRFVESFLPDYKRRKAIVKNGYHYRAN